MATLVPVLPSTAELRGAGTDSLVSGDRGDIADPRAPQGWHTRPALSHSLCPGTLVLLRHTPCPQTLFFLRHTRFALAHSPCPALSALPHSGDDLHHPRLPPAGGEPGDGGDPRGAPSRAGSVAGPPGSPPPEQVGSKQPGNKAKSAAGCAPPRLPPGPFPRPGWGRSPALTPAPAPARSPDGSVGAGAHGLQVPVAVPHFPEGFGDLLAVEAVLGGGHGAAAPCRHPPTKSPGGAREASAGLRRAEARRGEGPGLAALPRRRSLPLPAPAPLSPAGLLRGTGREPPAGPGQPGAACRTRQVPVRQGRSRVWQRLSPPPWWRHSRGAV